MNRSKVIYLCLLIVLWIFAASNIEAEQFQIILNQPTDAGVLAKITEAPKKVPDPNPLIHPDRNVPLIIMGDLQSYQPLRPLIGVISPRHRPLSPAQRGITSNNSSEGSHHYPPASEQTPSAGEIFDKIMMVNLRAQAYLVREPMPAAN